MLPFSGLVLPKASPILVANLGFNATYDSNDAGNPTASLTITVKRDGTWTVTVGTDDVLTGSPASGTWCSNGYLDVGDQAEVQFVVANEVNTPVITNNASSYTAITGDITIQVLRGGGATASADVTINVRANSVVTTDTTTITVDGT